MLRINMILAGNLQSKFSNETEFLPKGKKFEKTLFETQCN